MEYQNINENKNQKKEHDFRNIALTIVGLFVILAAVSGGTFAYYAFSATSNNVVGGAAATASNLTLTVEKVSGGTILVPQLDSYIKRAIVGKDSNNHCIDGNNNTVCQIYKINVKNTGSTNFTYNLRLKFTWGSGDSFNNLKWTTTTAASTSATTVTSVTAGTTYSATTSNQNIASGQTLTATNGNTDYYIVIWLSETNLEQKDTDKGTFTGTIEMTDPNGNQYLTSTFTSNT